MLAVKVVDKGVSVIIASVMMVLIVTAAGAIIYSYAQGSFSDLSSSFTEMFTSSSEALKEQAVVVDYLYVNASTSNISFAIYNYGSMDVEVVSVIINGTACDPLEEVYIIPGNWSWANVSFPSFLISENFYVAKIVSKRGNVYEFSFSPR